MSQPVTYRFGPLERHGILGPVRLGQALLLAAGSLSAIVVINASPTAAGAFAATLLFAVVAAVAVLPFAGRTFGEWLPVVAYFAGRLARGNARSRSGAPGTGARVVAMGSRGARLLHPIPEPPRTLGDLRIRVAEHRNRQVGILAQERGRRLTAVLACRAMTFALLEPATQARRLSQWGQLLSTVAGSSVSRLQWIERTAPAQGDELARWLGRECDEAVPLRGSAMVDSYLELIGTSAHVAHEHELLLAIQVDSRDVRERGADAPLRALVEQTEQVARGLEAADVSVLGALGPAQIVRVLRTAFDPYARAELTGPASAEADPSGQPELPDASAWPLGTREAWDHYRSDGALHATYWIGAWPRVEVSAMFMDALLGRSSCVRTVAVTFEPIPPERSTRDAEAAVTRDHADRELRARFGQSQTARQRQAEDAALRREAELASGHSEVRFSGFVTVSGRDAEELRRACAEVTEHASRARLELHRMYGQQAPAFTFTLPLCRGLK